MDEIAQIELGTPDTTNGASSVESSPVNPSPVESSSIEPSPPNDAEAATTVIKPLRRVLISYGQCGTHWLTEMISTVLGKPSIGLGLFDPETLVAILEGCGHQRLIYEHFWFDRHGAILDPARYPDLRMLLLHRHPLDQFISLTWQRVKITGELANLDPSSDPDQIARGMLLGNYDEKFGFPYSQSFLETHKRNLLDWLDSGRCLDVTYEDLVERPKEELIRCLNHLEIPYDDAVVSSVVEQYRRRTLDNHDAPAQSEREQLDRKGIPGEWRSVFQPDDVPILREKYGDSVHRQGYGLSRFEQKPLRRVLISAGRSGTHWLKEMISAALGTPPVERGAWDTQTLQPILEGCGRRRLVYEHFRFNLHGAILDLARYPDMRMVLLHRHPFDQFISQAWYHLRVTNLWRGKINGRWELPNPDLDPGEVARALLLGDYDVHFGGSYAKGFIGTLEWTSINWIESGRCYPVKYEDLVERTEEELARILNYLDIRFDEADIPQIVEKNRFENLSGGRSRGESDGSHHYRKGTPGEWRSVFTDDDIPILRERYGKYLASLGYTI